MSQPPLLEQINDIRELRGIFLDIHERFEDADYTPEMESAEQQLRERHEAHFDGRQNPVGSQWPALSPVTIARKGHDIPLVDTGRLRASVLETGHPDHVRELLPLGRGLTFGSSVEYGLFHQNGTARIPQREFAGMNDGTVTEICESVADRAVDALIYRLK